MNMLRRIRNWRKRTEMQLPMLPYPPYQIHYDKH